MSQENLKKVISNQVGKATDLANDAIAQVSSTVTDAKNLAENALNSVKDKFPFGDKKSVLSQLDFNIQKNINARLIASEIQK